MPAPLRNPLLRQVTADPLLISPTREEMFRADIAHIAANDNAETLLASSTTLASATQEDVDFWPSADSWQASYRPYVVKNGVLQIPVMGVLLSKFPWQLGRWATGYKYIEMAFRRGMADPAVKGIALVIDSYGGEVTDCFELVDKIYNWRSEKPIQAFAANHAYSAAYAIASAPGKGRLSVTRSGGVGSIGVVTMHIEFSGMLEQDGVKATFVFAGDHKVDGNPYEKLKPAARARMQKRIDKIYGVFTSTVARNRDMNEDDIRATEALTYDAEEAIEVGLADRIGALEDEMVVFTTEVNEQGDEFMTNLQPSTTGKKPGETNASAPEASGFTQEQVDAATASARAEGVTAGATAEKARINGILACENATKRPKAALQCALASEMSVEQANAFLGGLDEEKAAAAPPAPQDTNAITGKVTGTTKTNVSHFEQHMNSTTHPNVSPEPDDDQATTEGNQSNELLSAYGRATGMQRKKSA